MAIFFSSYYAKNEEIVPRFGNFRNGKKQVERTINRQQTTVKHFKGAKVRFLKKKGNVQYRETLVSHFQ